MTLKNIASDIGQRHDALALFSGGLDSILAVKVIQAQGLSVLALHFVSPFFGTPGKAGFWRREYGIEVRPVLLGQDYLRTVLLSPKRGYGKSLNPCVDCHTYMVRMAKSLMPSLGAKLIISGEVLGQRPMSQRRDALHAVRKDSGADDVLLRPLSARVMEPSEVEKRGLVDRERLKGFSGRGRKAQMELAAEFGITTIPTPGGGCMLTEAEPSARYLKVMRAVGEPRPEDFELCNQGRVYWAGEHMLTIGRNKADNERLRTMALDSDLLFDLRDFPSPVAIGRQFPGRPWPEEAVRDAAAFAASFSPKALREAPGQQVVMAVTQGGTTREVSVLPSRETPLGWAEPRWEAVRDERHALAEP